MHKLIRCALYSVPALVSVTGFAQTISLSDEDFNKMITSAGTALTIAKQAHGVAAARQPKIFGQSEAEKASVDGQLETLDSQIKALTRQTPYFLPATVRNAAQDYTSCTVAAFDLSDCTRVSSAVSLQTYDYLERAATVAEIFRPMAPKTQQLLAGLAAMKEITNETTALSAMRGAQYGIYAGPNYSLGGEGKWKAGFEALVRFDSPISNRGLRSFAEVGYQSINALEEATGAVAPDPETPAPEAPATDTLNPFLKEGGYFRANGGLQYLFNDYYGIQAGYGFSSRPNDVAEAHLYHRQFGGLHVQRVYPKGVTARFFAGYAHDEFWQREVPEDPAMPEGPKRLEENFGRLNVEIFMATPLVSKLHAAARIFIDAPADDRGPSDVRVSALIYYDLPSWLGNFKLGEAKP